MEAEYLEISGKYVINFVAYFSVEYILFGKEMKRWLFPEFKDSYFKFTIIFIYTYFNYMYYIDKIKSTRQKNLKYRINHYL